MNARANPAALPAAPALLPHVDLRIYDALCGALGEVVAESWFTRLQLDSVTGQRAILSQPTSFLRRWALDHYPGQLLAAVRTVAPDVEVVEIVVRSAARFAGVARGEPKLALVSTSAPMPAAAPEPLVAKAPTPVAPPPPSILPSPLDRRFVLDSFRTASSNRLAHSAALRILDSARGHTLLFNPLYVYGGTGLGKTHLLQAMAHESAARGLRAVYLTAEAFMYRFVVALKAQATASFSGLLRDVDILLIDDVHFLQGKTIQREFSATITAMVANAKQVVVAADRPPNDLEHLDEHLRSRLAGGLCTEIVAPERDLRIAILRRLVIEARAAGAPDFDLPAVVLEHVADAISGGGRALTGAVNRLLAHSSPGTPMTVPQAEHAIRDLVQQREPKRVKIEDIQRLVAAHYGVAKTDILSSRRTANVVRPRQIAMFLAKELTMRSLPEIGRRFGGRDHTTVLHAVRKILDLAARDVAFSGEVANLRAQLEAR